MRTAILALMLCATSISAAPPNVLLIITDDQGYGDLRLHGNPVLRTPTMDSLARDGAVLKNFYVCPVCSPTRSALLTGQWNYRTGIVDTFIGRSLMRPDVPTLPDLLAKAGYRTGLFGKWHLGDNYPLRPEDRGFQQTLWSQGGGLAQPSDHPDAAPDKAYFDPILKKNGVEHRAKGYCTDVFTDAAIDFLKADPDKPFFAYVAYNAPHGPLQVPEQWVEPYRKADLTAKGFPAIGQPWAGNKLNTEAISKAYGMIENVDYNIRRMLDVLQSAGKLRDTIVIFLTDNGPGGVRFNSGLRNRKGTVYEGGIKVPCFVRWSGTISAGSTVDVPLAHIDWTPTLLELCGVKSALTFDGRSMASLLTGKDGSWPERTLFFQWHRGDVPEKNRAFAARGPRYKLVQSRGVEERAAWQPQFELFDLTNDPYEQTDLSAKLPEEVTKLKNAYYAWFDDVTRKGFEPPRIIVGSDQEKITRLSRQDWRGPDAGWTPTSIGHWKIQIAKAGRYQIRMMSRTPFATANIKFDERESGLYASAIMTKHITITELLKAGPLTISATIDPDGRKRGVDYLELQYLGDK